MKCRACGRVMSQESVIVHRGINCYDATLYMCGRHVVRRVVLVVSE